MILKRYGKKKNLDQIQKVLEKGGQSYFQTLETVMFFFDWHSFFPSDKYGKGLLKEILKNLKRTEVIMAIIMDIEKIQTLPTNAMIFRLFQKGEKEEEESFFEQVERQYLGSNSFPDMDDTAVLKIRYERLRESFDDLKRDSSYVLENVKG
ncbi:hypothetical protein B7P33_13030 [Sediminicola luteus]|uniref:Uncharacterized protein n=2 Tax=Sediminicola luteus TaxID=319238 RepID=A0A2A4G673_9FLAO|nr:hypothetical protein B7P33_13030 [Sediminicola luteus]